MAFNLIPTGTILQFGGATAPSGWLLCDGASVAIASYPALSNAIGVLWGNPGGGSFNLPNLTGAFVRGIGTSGAHVGPATVGSVQTHATAANGLSASGGGHNHTEVIDPYYSGLVGLEYGVGSDSLVTTMARVGAPPRTGSKIYANATGSPHGHGFAGDSETRPNSKGVNYIIKI